MTIRTGNFEGFGRSAVAGLVMSSIEVVVGPELASADPPGSRAVNPRDVPLLPSAAVA